jgi:hypothetical protein
MACHADPAEGMIMPPTEEYWAPGWGHVQKRTGDASAPYYNPTPAPLVPGPFAVIERGIVLSRPHGRGYTLNGDVARLSTGALVCRYQTKGADGHDITAVDRWHPNDDVERVTRPLGTDWAAWATRKRHSLGIDRGELGPRPDDAEDVVKFRREFPTLARRFKLDAAVPVTRVFPVGPVTIQGVLGVHFWHDTIDKHSVEANFGGWGRLADAGPLTEETYWTLASVSVLTANAAAIASKSGCIRSRYLLEPEHEKLLKRPDRIHTADVATVFGRAGPLTLAWIESFDRLQEPFG